MKNHRFVTDATRAKELPLVSSNKEISDAHLVNLARNSGLRLATFDAPLCSKEWARGVAENPIY